MEAPTEHAAQALHLAESEGVSQSLAVSAGGGAWWWPQSAARLAAEGP
ncbi:MAG TPA: hypothetical protein VGD30_04115 [Telluria sp.]